MGQGSGPVPDLPALPDHTQLGADGRAPTSAGSAPDDHCAPIRPDAGTVGAFGERERDPSGLSTPVFWLSLLVAAGLAAVWLRAGQAAHLYHAYYLVAAVCLATATCCIGVVGLTVVLWRRKLRRASDAGTETALQRSSPSSD